MQSHHCVAWLALAACGGAAGPAFRATDASFTPRRGPTPRVYLLRGDVPDVGVRSVGIIEVKGRRERAIASAAAKGAELGCWALIEHHVFVTMPRAHLRFGARVYLAHGSAPHVTSLSPPTVLDLHCVVLDDARQLPRA